MLFPEPVLLSLRKELCSIQYFRNGESGNSTGVPKEVFDCNHLLKLSNDIQA